MTPYPEFTKFTISWSVQFDQLTIYFWKRRFEGNTIRLFVLRIELCGENWKLKTEKWKVKSEKSVKNETFFPSRISMASTLKESFWFANRFFSFCKLSFFLLVFFSLFRLQLYFDFLFQSVSVLPSF